MLFSLNYFQFNLSICLNFNSTVLSMDKNENSRKSFAAKENIFKESIKGEISLGGIHRGMYDTNISVPLLNKI